MDGVSESRRSGPPSALFLTESLGEAATAEERVVPAGVARLDDAGGDVTENSSKSPTKTGTEDGEKSAGDCARAREQDPPATSIVRKSKMNPRRKENCGG